MSENIITVYLIAINPPVVIPLARVGSNSFSNVNLLEMIYPVKTYSKAYICVEKMNTTINESIPSVQLICKGLINTYECVISTERLVCEPTDILDVIYTDNSGLNFNLNSSLINYKNSGTDCWREISVGNLTNFELKIKKDSNALFNMIFLILKIKLIE